MEPGDVPSPALHEAQQGDTPLGGFAKRVRGIFRFENPLVESLGLGVLASFLFFFAELERDLEVFRLFLGLLLEGSIGLAGEDRLDGADETIGWPEAGDAVEFFTLGVDDEQGGEAADAVALGDILSLSLLGVDLE
jgi:hypothetical protein